MEGLHLGSKAVPAILGATITSYGAHVVVDRAGYEGLAFIISAGTMAFTTTDKLTWKVQAGTESNGSDMVDLETHEYVGGKRSDNTAWDLLMDNAADDEEVFVITVKPGNKRYYRLFSTEGGTVSAIVSAVALLYHARHQ